MIFFLFRFIVVLILKNLDYLALVLGLGAQTNSAADSATAAAAAAGLLPPMTVQNLAALAAMTQPSLTNAANNPGSAQLTNTAALLCKY